MGPGPSSSHTIGPMRITYDFYQRCTKLPADQLAKATGAQGAPVRQPERDGQGARHRARRARRHHRQGAGDRSIRCSSTSWRDKPDQTFPVKLGGKTFNASLKDIIYDAPKGDFPHPNTMTCKLHGGRARCCSSRSTTRSAAASSSGRATSRRRRAQPKYPYATMKELQEHADEEQAHLRAGRDGQRGGGLRQERGRDQRLPRQDLDGDGEHREVGARGAAVRRCPGRSSSRPRPARSTSGPWTTSTSGQRGRRRGRGLRPGRLRGERARPPGRDRADRRLGRRHSGARLRARRGRPQAAAGEDPRGPAGRRGDRLPVQAQRDAGRRRGRLPGGDRRRVRHGRGADRPGARLRPPGRRQRRRVGAASTTSA